MRWAAFKLWDRKFRPAKENAAASEPDDVLDRVDCPDVPLERLVVEVLAD